MTRTLARPPSPSRARSARPASTGPYICDGHGAASPGYQGPHHAKLPAEGGIVSTDYTRPYLEAGHASESPSSQHTPGPMQPPTSTGVPTNEPARGFMSSDRIASMQHAMTVMHDTLTHRFPDVCPMEASLQIGSNPVPVPHGVPQPAKAPGARKAAKADKRAKAKARKAAKVKARKQAKAAKAERKKVQALVLKGTMSVEAARVKMGMKPLTPVAPPESPQSAGAAAPLVAALDPDALKAALTEATAPLQAQLAKSRKAVRRRTRPCAGRARRSASSRRPRTPSPPSPTPHSPP